MRSNISIIIPCLNEEDNLAELLPKLSADPNLQVIVVDGGSSDNSCHIAEKAGCLVLQSPRGRGRQMNTGVTAARFRQLLFLHADTRLPDDFEIAVNTALTQDGVAGGAFRLATDSSRFGLRLICFFANLRAKLFSLPYGDQAIFTTRSQFDAVSGYPEIEIMEDYVFIKKLGKRGKIKILQEKAVTSARRWENMGLLKTTIINQIMITGYWLGIRPHTLARVYQRLKGLKL